MRSFKTEAIILKRRNVGEADRLLTIYTPHHGKIYVKAPGVRKIVSRRSPHIEPLNHSILNLYIGKNSFIVQEAQTVESFAGVKNDLTRIGFAYHICELIDGLCPENQESKDIFSLLIQTLKKLSQGNNLVAVIHEFEIDLLTFLGFFRPSPSRPIDDVSEFVEYLMERKLKTRQILPKLLKD